MIVDQKLCFFPNVCATIAFEFDDDIESYGEGRHSYMFPDVRKSLIFYYYVIFLLQVSMWNSFLKLRIFPFIYNLLIVFGYEWMLDLLKCFPASCEFFHLRLHWLFPWDAEPYFHRWDKSHLLVAHLYFIHFLIQFTNMSINILAFTFTGNVNI